LVIGALLSALFNAILVYEAISGKQGWRKIAGSGLTTIVLLFSVASQMGWLKLHGM
jgi:hypothetical protein